MAAATRAAREPDFWFGVYIKRMSDGNVFTLCDIMQKITMSDEDIKRFRQADDSLVAKLVLALNAWKSGF